MFMLTITHSNAHNNVHNNTLNMHTYIIYIIANSIIRRDVEVLQVSADTIKSTVFLSVTKHNGLNLEYVHSSLDILRAYSVEYI